MLTCCLSLRAAYAYGLLTLTVCLSSRVACAYGLLNDFLPFIYASLFFAFRYLWEAEQEYPHVTLPQIQSRIPTSLPSFAHDPSSAGESLVPLLAFATAHVPDSK